jgi:hypothetical protein
MLHDKSGGGVYDEVDLSLLVLSAPRLRSRWNARNGRNERLSSVDVHYGSFDRIAESPVSRRTLDGRAEPLEAL